MIAVVYPWQNLAGFSLQGFPLLVQATKLTDTVLLHIK